MKRSDFIKEVLESKENTVFVTKEQVENSLEIFESLGMLPPRILVALGEERALELDMDPEEEVCSWEWEDES